MTEHTYTIKTGDTAPEPPDFIVVRDDGQERPVIAETAETAIEAAAEVDAFEANAQQRRTAADFDTLTQTHIDGVALSLGYRNGDAVASFVVSSVPAWAAEAERFVRWRDAVWMAAYEAQEAGFSHEQFMAALVEAGKDRPT